MTSHWYSTWVHGAASRRNLHYGDWAAPVLRWVRRQIVSIRIAAVGLLRLLKAASPDQWFLLGFVLLFVAFFVVLLVQPSSVGRGGR